MSHYLLYNIFLNNTLNNIVLQEITSYQNKKYAIQGILCYSLGVFLLILKMSIGYQ